MPRGVSAAKAANETPEQRMARLKARREREANLVRRQTLKNAENALRQARRALEDNDNGEHDKWIGIAKSSLNSYAELASDSTRNSSELQQ